MSGGMQPPAGDSFEQMLERLIEKVLRRVLDERDRPASEVTIEAYAAARSISVSTVRKAVRSGVLPSRKIGRAVRVPGDVEIPAGKTKPRKARQLKPKEQDAATVTSIVGLVRGGRS